MGGRNGHHGLKVIPGTTNESFAAVLHKLEFDYHESSKAYKEYSIRFNKGYFDGYVDWLMVLHRGSTQDI
jgi:hypothetical protein